MERSDMPAIMESYPLREFKGAAHIGSADK